MAYSGIIRPKILKKCLNKTNTMKDFFIVALNMTLLFLALGFVYWIVWIWSKQSIKEIKDRYPQAYKRHYKDS